MKKIILLIITMLIGLIMLKIFTIAPQGWKRSLVNPMGQVESREEEGTLVSSPEPSPDALPAGRQAPKTFQFDSSTDLNAELEKVNPQVLDSDFF